MKNPAAHKKTIFEMLKRSSRIIAALCCIAVPVALIAALLSLQEISAMNQSRSNAPDLPLYYITTFRKFISCVTLAAVMAISARIFFRIAKDGLPFTQRNARAVHIIALILLADAVIPAVAAGCITGTFLGTGGIVSPYALITGLLFLFIAHIIRYGAMLQQESDETL